MKNKLALIMSILLTGTHLCGVGFYKYKNNALCFAIKKNQSYLAKFLIFFGANVNAWDSDDCTPLHWAAKNGRTDIVQLLLEKGADVNAKDDSGMAPLHYAAENGQKDIVQLLLEKGADVNAKEKDHDWTPLRLAAKNGHTDIVQLLLENGANVNAKDSHDWTPLHWAAKNGHKDVVQLLLENGANVNATDKNGDTPLHWAAKNRYEEIANEIKNYSRIKNCALFGKTSEIYSLYKEQKDLLPYVAKKAGVKEIKTLDDLYFALFSLALTCGEDGSLSAYFDHFGTNMVQFCENLLKKENNTENDTQKRLAKIWQEYRKHHKKASLFAKKVFGTQLPVYDLKKRLPPEITANVLSYL